MLRGIFKNLIKPASWPYLIYILINNALVFLFVYGVYYFYKGINVSSQEALAIIRTEATYAGLIFLAVNILLTIFFISPIGQGMMVWTFGAKKIESLQFSKEDKLKIEQIFAEVYAKAKEVDEHLSDKVQLRIANENVKNAYAYGSRYIIITTGLLALSPAEVAGVIAHEFGHLSRCDNYLELFNYSTNIFAGIALCLIRIASFFIILFENGRSRTFIFRILFYFLFKVVLNTIIQIWLLIGIVLSRLASRSAEYKADAFAVKAGLGKELAAALNKIDNGGRCGGLIFRTHPHTPDRIAAILEQINEGDLNTNTNLGINFRKQTSTSE